MTALLSFSLIEEARGAWRLRMNKGGRMVEYRFPSKVAALAWLDAAIELEGAMAS